jgi:predicted permease
MLSALVVADLMVPDKSFDIGWHQLAASVPALALIAVGVVLIRNRNRRFGLAGIGLTLSGCVILGAISAVLTLLATERGRGFQYDRTTGYGRVIAFAKRVEISSLRAHRCD